MSRRLKIIRLFYRMLSVLQGSFAKETYNFKEPTNRSHPIVLRNKPSCNELCHEVHAATSQKQFQETTAMHCVMKQLRLCHAMTAGRSRTMCSHLQYEETAVVYIIAIGVSRCLSRMRRVTSNMPLLTVWRKTRRSNSRYVSCCLCQMRRVTNSVPLLTVWRDKNLSFKQSLCFSLSLSYAPCHELSALTDSLEKQTVV